MLFLGAGLLILSTPLMRSISSVCTEFASLLVSSFIDSLPMIHSRNKSKLHNQLNKYQHLRHLWPCNISLTSAKIRVERMKLLYKREQEFLQKYGRSCFLQSPLEQKVYKQFQGLLNKIEYKNKRTRTVRIFVFQFSTQL